MLRSEVQVLFGFDRWATRRILNASIAAFEAAPADWSRPAVVGERGLGGILVHALGAHQRWRAAWQSNPETPRPELEPLLSPIDLRTRWESEWAALDEWLAGLAQAATDEIWDGLPLWQPMLHVINHGTQHRSEAAVLLTEAGHSPGDLDLIDFVAERSPD